MKKLKLIGLTFLMIVSTTAFAQEKSEIVMTKSELESFLEMIAEARRSQIKAKNEARAKNELAELRYKYNNRIDSRGNVNRDNYEILGELDRINARLDYMNGRSAGTNGRGSSSTVVVPGGANAPAYIPYNQGQQFVSDNKQDLATAKTISELERRLDSLKSVQTDNQEIADLKNQFQSLEEKLANAENPTERRSLLEELLAKFKNFKKQVFFANNSDQLNSNDLAYIQDVAQVLNQYQELSIVLEGWASTTGKPDYNKQLSMRRAESVEQALLRKGISPARIVSSFRGEDKSATEAMARRVDMSIILK